MSSSSSAAAEEPQPARETGKRKLRGSCDRCGSAKRCCDKLRPACRRCLKAKVQCVYSEMKVPRKRPSAGTLPTFAELQAPPTAAAASDAGSVSGGSDNGDFNNSASSDNGVCGAFQTPPQLLDDPGRRLPCFTELAGRHEMAYLTSYLFAAGGLVPFIEGSLIAREFLQQEAQAAAIAAGSVVCQTARGVRGALLAATSCGALAVGCVALGCGTYVDASAHTALMLQSHVHGQHALAIMMAEATVGTGMAGRSNGSSAGGGGSDSGSSSSGGGGSSSGGSSADGGDRLPPEDDALLFCLHLQQFLYCGMLNDLYGMTESVQSAVDVYATAVAGAKGAAAFSLETQQKLLPSLLVVLADVRRRGDSVAMDMLMEARVEMLTSNTVAVPSNGLSSVTTTRPHVVEAPYLLSVASRLFFCRSAPEERAAAVQWARWCFENALQRLRATGQGALLVCFAHSVLVEALLCLPGDLSTAKVELAESSREVLRVMVRCPGAWLALESVQAYFDLSAAIQEGGLHDALAAAWRVCQASCAAVLRPAAPHSLAVSPWLVTGEAEPIVSLSERVKAQRKLQRR